MEALIEDRFCFDMISGVLMLHLLFVLKLLIKENYFRASKENRVSYTSLFDTDENTKSIGVNELGLDTSLLDLTKAIQHYELIKKKGTENKPMSYTFVTMPPNDTYKVTEKDGGREVQPSVRLLKIVTSGTYPGYLCLMPQDPAKWPECVGWYLTRAIHTLNVYQIPNSPVPNVYKKQFQGLNYHSWPTTASSWNDRKTHSGWPSKSSTREAMTKGCTLIKRTHEFCGRPNIEWMFVFHDAENVLVQSFTGPMKYGFNIFKAFVEYHIRSLGMFYCCEKIPIEAWSSNTGGCVMYLVAWLLQHVHGHNLPN